MRSVAAAIPTGSCNNIGMKLAALVFLVASTAYASQEQIHTPKQVTLVAATQLFGDVEVTATADPSGNVTGLSIKAKGVAVSVPAASFAALPKLAVKTLEIRSEAGYDPKPWLYVVFTSAKQTIHIAVHDGKLAAMIDTVDAKGATKHEDKPL